MTCSVNNPASRAVILAMVGSLRMFRNGVERYWIEVVNDNPKPQEWKSEELSQGRIIDYKAFNFVDGEGVRNSLYVSAVCFTARVVIM